MSKVTLKQQLRNNFLAIFSIFIAIISLSYNTWRNEATEYNRNVRTSSFQILMSLAELQLLVDYAYYSEQENKDDPIKGWRHVLYIRDLAKTVTPEIQGHADKLQQTWQDNWNQMGENQQSSALITKTIQEHRQAVLTTLKALK